MKFALISAVAALAVAAPAAAHAPSGVGTVTTAVAVPSGDLDLSRTSDAMTMFRRLDRAAAATCGASRFSARDYQAAVRRTACYRDAMDPAVASLNAPAVNDIYRERASSLAER